MTDSLERLRRQIDRARQLGTVVRAMKVLATISIGQYEQAVRSLDDYVRTVHLGLATCIRSQGMLPKVQASEGSVAAVVFGSDQGLVGGFNEVIANFAREELARRGGTCRQWVIGERLAARLAAEDVSPPRTLALPSSATAISALVTQVLMEVEEYCSTRPGLPVYVLFNRLLAGALYEPACEQLLPFDVQWPRFAQLAWPTHNLPELIGPVEPALRAHLREYLFASLYRACAESLASENASRLASMQRAERNIGSLIDSLTQTFNDLRQSAIDEEIFDVIAGFEALPRR